MKPVFIMLSAVALWGCMTMPPRPADRTEWMALHSRIYDDATQKQLLTAAERVLRLADSDFVFSYPPGALHARRDWSVYMVLAAAFGQDYWRIQAQPVDGGMRLLVRVSRTSGAITPTPVSTTGTATAFAATSSTMPGREVWWGAPYAIFWSRLDYMLERGDQWLSCLAAQQRFAARTATQYVGVLCGVTADERFPPGVSPPPKPEPAGWRPGS